MPRILIVDDRAASREYLVALLARRKYQVTEAGDGAEALCLLKSEPADLIITDVEMPNMDGYELVRALRSQTDLSHVPVIFLSGHFQEWEARDLARACGVSQVLTKPCAPEAIYKAIDACLRTAESDATSTLSKRSRELTEANQRLEQVVADLTRSEERLRAIVDHTPAIVYLKDLQGRYLLSNRALQSYVGVKGEEIEGKFASDFFPPAVADMTRRHHEHAITSAKPVEVEEETTLGNETRTWLTTRFPLFDERAAISAIGGIAIDISARKRYEKLLARNALDLENRARLQECIAELSFQALSRMATNRLLDKAVVLIGKALRADYCRAMLVSTEGKLTQVAVHGSLVPGGQSGDTGPLSDSLATYTASVGAPVMANDLASESRFESKPLCDDFGLASAIAVTVETRGNICAVLEIFNRKPGGFNRRPRIFSADHVNFAQSAANIIAAAIQRNQAVEDLRSARSHLSHLISSSPAVIYALRIKGETLEPTTVGENILRVTGYSVKETLRPEWWLEHTFPQEILRAAADDSAAHTGSHLVREYALIRADGKTIWLRDECRFLVGSVGTPLEIVGSLSDVTEQKALEEQFRRAQKMETFGQLAGGIAHDFNNLLTVISGFAQFELANEDLQPSSRHAMETISKAAAGAIGLTRQLVAFSRQQALSPQVTDLGAIIENFLHMFRRVIGADITLRTNIGAGLPPVNVDTGMIEQILLNLTVNARDAMPEGGNLSIGIDSVVLRGDDVTPGSDGRPGAFVCLKVGDTGCGMSQETLSHIFEPFFTTKDVGKGTGLGLATVHGIVRQHNGWVEVESQAGVGSVFRIFLPAASWNAEEADEMVHLQKQSADDSTILLVEDEAMVRSFTEMFLRKRGYRMLTADCAAAAEAILAKPGARVDLLMTDIVLPGGVSGLELAAKVQRVRPGLRVLYTSGYHTNRNGRGPRLKEGVNFVRKPFELDRLAATVERCLKRKSTAATNAA
jgi:PAS domain S-box-containing protein